MSFFGNYPYPTILKQTLSTSKENYLPPYTPVERISFFPHARRGTRITFQINEQPKKGIGKPFP